MTVKRVLKLSRIVLVSPKGYIVVKRGEELETIRVSNPSLYREGEMYELEETVAASVPESQTQEATEAKATSKGWTKRDKKNDDPD